MKKKKLLSSYIFVYLVACTIIFTNHNILAIASDTKTDQTKEKRSQELFSIIRCIPCQGESIKDSQNHFSISLRHFIKEQIDKNKSDSEILNIIKSRYGEDAILKPSFELKNLILWCLPYSLLIFVLWIVMSRIIRAAKKEKQNIK